MTTMTLPREPVRVPAIISIIQELREREARAFVAVWDTDVTYSAPSDDDDELLATGLAMSRHALDCLRASSVQS